MTFYAAVIRVMISNTAAAAAAAAVIVSNDRNKIPSIRNILINVY